MSVISITITPSSHETVIGIPDTITVSTNEPATVFYTLNGEDPDTFSTVYVAPILMPQYLLSVTLSVVASNGIDISAIIQNTYNADIMSLPTISGDRLPHAGVSPFDGYQTQFDLFPFGSNFQNPNQTFTNTANSGTTVYNPELPATPNFFNSDGYETDGYTNKPLEYFQFKNIYSTTNDKGEVFPGVGNLPAKTTVIGKTTAIDYTQKYSSTSDKIFNPRAMVCFQDTTTEDPTNPVIINRQYFNLQNSELNSDGNLLFSTGLDGPTISGSYLRSHYNERDQTITHYYYDNSVCKWIISKTPYQPTSKDAGSLAHVVFGRKSPLGGVGIVYKWVPFQRRVLG